MKSEKALSSAFDSFRTAALPPHSAERLCLSGTCLSCFLRLRLMGLRLSLRSIMEIPTVRQSLTALCGGKAAALDYRYDIQSAMANSDNGI